MAIWQGVFRFFGLGLMAVLLAKLDWQQLFTLFRHGEHGWLVLGVVINTVFFIIKGVRWRFLLTMIAIDYSWWRAIPVYMAGSFLGAVTPGRVADLIKASYLHQDLSVPYGQGIVTVVMDRLLDLLVLAIIALLVVSVGVLGSHYVLPVFCFISVLLAILVVLWRLPLFDRLMNKLGPTFHTMITTWRAFHRPVLAVPLFLSVVAYGLLYGGGYCLAMGIGLPLTFYQIIYVMTLGNLVGLLPFTVAGIGTRDLAMVLLFQELGLPSVAALAFSMGYLVSNLLLGNLPGCLYWFWQPVDRLLQPSVTAGQKE